MTRKPSRGATPHLSTLVLHQVRLGELDATQTASARAHLADCDRCTARLDAQHRERAAFVLRPMPDAIRTAAAPQRRPSAVWRWIAPVALVAAAAVAWLLVAGGVPPSGDRIVTRGELPRVEVWVDLGDGPRPLRPAERLVPGDRLQLRYDPRDAAHVAFAGRDGTGLVEVYGAFPALGPGLVDAPFGLRLDDAPGDQEFFVLTADRYLDAGTVHDAVTVGVDGVDVARIVVPKEHGR